MVKYKNFTNLTTITAVNSHYVLKYLCHEKIFKANLYHATKPIHGLLMSDAVEYSP